MNHKPIEGFSKLPKQGKIDWLVNEYLEGDQEYQNILKQYWNEDADLQKLHEEFSENTISNFLYALRNCSELSDRRKIIGTANGC